MKLGVCYYPEQWDESLWPSDARRMAELGLSTVRIAEFAWALIEPAPGRFEWDWLDRAINTLAEAGLEVVLGTPTAAPPQWLVDQHPDVLAVDAQGRTKQFGSRRHYCFSSEAFHAASARVVTAMAERYGRHPAVVAWQTDNEYGCHDTTVSHSPNALKRFRIWLAARYGSIEALNQAWGNVFWSMSYNSFDDVGLSVAMPAPPNPSQLLALHRFASDEVLRYNRMQVEILRRHAPGRPVLHNFMGFFGNFEHHEMGRDLDIASWDSYPLGHLDGMNVASEAEKLAHRRTGHPDIAAFNHDLYRGVVASGRWWVMEQQAGAVNWAPWNALPLPGMVRAWTWEAFAHGAELVSYFRWRQVPYAQEQLHSGLNTPDNLLATGSEEAAQVARELATVPVETSQPARVALVVDYAGKWAIDALPNSADFEVHTLQLRWYSALRRLGLDVDVLPASADFSSYLLVAVPTLPVVPADFVDRLQRSGAQLVFGPRSGSRTAEMHMAEGLPPGPLRAFFPGLRVTAVEGLRPGIALPVSLGDTAAEVTRWRDVLNLPAGLTAEGRYPDGHAAVVLHGAARYVSGWLCDAGLEEVMVRAARAAGLPDQPLPAGLRLRRRGGLQFAIHYGEHAVQLPAPADARFVLGGPVLEAGGVAAWWLD
ncbi:MAG TPA: beta-galactosidase [Ideonella sp.]|uniref:beta-galactosidase n=1 Tax=Ideonella sp. TaxID=1929293 RepID=UPI002B7483FF|nr:beta-galactosidase [Ideonella sp.]HSI47378.1 beta-galactosidase [Ideonella sp.]